MWSVFAVAMIGFLAGLIGVAPTSEGVDRERPPSSMTMSPERTGGAKGELMWVEEGSQIRVLQAQQRGQRGRGRVERLRKQAEQWKGIYQGLSPEDKEALSKAMENAVQKVQGLTPEQKQQMAQSVKQYATSLKNLSPEQKQQLQQELQKAAEAYKALTPEQKQAMVSDFATSMGESGSISDAQKKQLKQLYQQMIGGK